MSTLICDYVGSNFPGGKKTDRKFFASFPRSVSDGITHEILKRLGYGGSCLYRDGSGKPDLFATYKNLPALDPAVSSFALMQAHALFSKNGDMQTDIDKKAVALESFMKSEEECRAVNNKFAARSFSSDECSILMYATRFVAHTLGACPKLGDLDYAFGPGACVTERRIKQTSAQWKLAGSPTISNSLFPILGELRALFPSWLANANTPVVTGRLEFVPKSHKTDRSIMVEPLLNAFLQKGVGSYLKKRLLREGLDLRDQNVQRERARIGSLTGAFATIDLSRASDTIAYALVLELLPLDWFDLLDCLRTPLVRYEKRLIVLEKFSSMGNGFTFELETLIFKALIRGIAQTFSIEDDSVCYGDDITCNPALAAKVCELFPKFGFTVNEEKSFLTGDFREACGGDYRLGVDVRPFFLRSLRDGGRWSPSKLVSFHNFLCRKPWFDAGGVKAYLLSVIPETLKKWGPDGYGDGHLICDDDPADYLPRVHRKTKNGKLRNAWYEGFRFETFVANAQRAESPENIALLPSYCAYARLSSDGPYDKDVVRPAKGVFISSRKVTVTHV